MAKNEQERRIADREGLKAGVEFFVDADVINARSVDLSETGIQFVTDQPVRVLMRIDQDGILAEHAAEIVWARRRDDGSMSYGLEFLGEDVAD